MYAFKYLASVYNKAADMYKCPRVALGIGATIRIGWPRYALCVFYWGWPFLP